MFKLLLPLGMKRFKAELNWHITSKYLCISYNDQDTFFSCYNDFDSPLKINETTGRHNHYETHNF